MLMRGISPSPGAALGLGHDLCLFAWLLSLPPSVSASRLRTQKTHIYIENGYLWQPAVLEHVCIFSFLPFNSPPNMCVLSQLSVVRDLIWCCQRAAASALQLLHNQPGSLRYYHSDT